MKFEFFLLFNKVKLLLHEKKQIENIRINQEKWRSFNVFSTYQAGHFNEAKKIRKELLATIFLLLYTNKAHFSRNIYRQASIMREFVKMENVDSNLNKLQSVFFIAKLKHHI